MIAPTANPDVLLVKSKDVFPIHTVNERRLCGGTSCGQDCWRLFNMAVSPDGTGVFLCRATATRRSGARRWAA